MMCNFADYFWKLLRIANIYEEQVHCVLHVDSVAATFQIRTHDL